MQSRPRAVVFGGSGVFGKLVAKELTLRGIDVVVAGRNLDRARQVAREIRCKATCADLVDVVSTAQAVRDVGVAVNCAGPFDKLDTTLLEQCLAAGCHYVDISDSRDYFRRALGFQQQFVEANLTAALGCSSLPGISGALAMTAHAAGAPVDRVRVTLFIGNDNAKGLAAVRSATSQLGRPIAAPQGTLRGLCSPERVDLPRPFLRRRVLNFESPEYDLFPPLLGVRSVSVKVGFELRLATAAFAWFARFAPRFGRVMLPKLAVANSLLRRVGCSGGVVLVELFDGEAKVRRAAMYGDRDAQRMAALPAVLATCKLLSADRPRTGVTTAYELLGASEVLDALVSAGFTLDVN